MAWHFTDESTDDPSTATVVATIRVGGSTGWTYGIGDASGNSSTARFAPLLNVTGGTVVTLAVPGGDGSTPATLNVGTGTGLTFSPTYSVITQVGVELIADLSYSGIDARFPSLSAIFKGGSNGQYTYTGDGFFPEDPPLLGMRVPPKSSAARWKDIEINRLAARKNCQQVRRGGTVRTAPNWHRAGTKVIYESPHTHLAEMQTVPPGQVKAFVNYNGFYSVIPADYSDRDQVTITGNIVFETNNPSPSTLYADTLVGYIYVWTA
jgi:hypothetical protein